MSVILEGICVLMSIINGMSIKFPWPTSHEPYLVELHHAKPYPHT